MRIGNNPNIHKEIDVNTGSHRVIIPVYIPNSEGYFKEAFQVFKICIQSLLLTINIDTKISLISNASSDEVNNYIKQLWDSKKIDKAIFNNENVGKMNAIITETRASFEEFITYSDADVFFDKGWLKQTHSIFNNIKKAGFVSMNPTPKNYTQANSTLLSNLSAVFFNNKKTNEVCSYSDLEHFHKSIGKDQVFTDNMYQNKIINITNKNIIIGAGHFCCTIRKTPTLKFVPTIKSNIGVSGGSETKYLDIPFDKTGLWRLSSPKAYVWHMGNVLDHDWAISKLNNLKNFKEEIFTFHTIPFKSATIFSSKIPYYIKVKVISILKKIKKI